MTVKHESIPSTVTEKYCHLPAQCYKKRNDRLILVIVSDIHVFI